MELFDTIAYGRPQILPVMTGKQLASGASVPFGYGLAGRMTDRDAYVLAPWPVNFLIQALL